MKKEQIINKIYDKIRYDLLHANLLYWEEDDTNKYPLVDHLSSGNDISTGRDEIDNLIEQIEIEPLIDSILALPLDVPSDDESHNHMIAMNLFQHKDEFGNDVWDEGKLHWAIQGYKIASKWMKEEIIKRNK